jgi:hypothetical protein
VSAATVGGGTRLTYLGRLDERAAPPPTYNDEVDDNDVPAAVAPATDDDDGDGDVLRET